MVCCCMLVGCIQGHRCGAAAEESHADEASWIYLLVIWTFCSHAIVIDVLENVSEQIVWVGRKRYRTRMISWTIFEVNDK